MKTLDTMSVTDAGALHMVAITSMDLTNIIDSRLGYSCGVRTLAVIIDTKSMLTSITHDSRALYAYTRSAHRPAVIDQITTATDLTDIMWGRNWGGKHTNTNTINLK